MNADAVVLCLGLEFPVNDMVFAGMDGRSGQELVIAIEGGEITIQ